MEVSGIIAGIDAQIQKLTEARKILESLSTPSATTGKPGRGRPKGSKNAVQETIAAATGAVKGKRKLSPEGRKRIAEAMKRRWAERRKDVPK